MEAAIRWSPHSTPDNQRFLVVNIAPDPSLTLYSISSLKGNKVAYNQVAKYEKFQTFNAFDWSKTVESLIALGKGNGSADLIKLHLNGDGSTGANRGAGGETKATFRLKQSRKCNSVSFSTQDWLATGADKIRSDACLNVYDIRREQPSGGEGNAGAGSQGSYAIRRLINGESVSSVRFFPSQPMEVVAGVDAKTVRIYDLRDHTPSMAAQATTRNVNNIAIDPLDENYFASAGSTDYPFVTIWDKRWMALSSAVQSSASSTASGSHTGAVLDFRPAVNNAIKTTVWSLRYSGLRRGRLAMCSSAGELKVIDMAEAISSNSSLIAAEYVPTNPFGGSGPWTTNRYVSASRALEPAYHHVTNGREYQRRIIAYDWMGAQQNGEQPVLALRPNREVDILRVPMVKLMVNITSREDLGVSYEDISVTEPRSYGLSTAAGTSLPKVPYEKPMSSASSTVAEDFGPREYAGEDESDGPFTNGANTEPMVRDSARIARLLSSSTVQRERCKRGYLFDCKKNATIVAGNWQLERLWEIVGRFRDQAAEDGMVHSGLDLSYVGVFGIWSESIGPSLHRRISPGANRVEDAIVGLNTTHDFPAFEGERTHFPEHRQLCLMLCGWKFTSDTLEAECQELIDRGLYYQAIVQAVLHGYKHLALNLLRTLIRGKTIPNIGLGALLAATMSKQSSDSSGSTSSLSSASRGSGGEGSQLNDEQKEMCNWMAADTEEPALKALLTFLSTGDWRDVMKTNYLHLGYRLALGLKYLNDTELSGFLQTETLRAVKNGDLEGILLTGLGEQAMDLFQTYIARTSPPDLQTAVLATAFTNPAYADDVRWEMWKETYFTQMQAWRLFIPRTKFQVQHTRMARTRDGSSLVTPPPAQVTLRCLHCQNSLARPSSAGNVVPNGLAITQTSHVSTSSTVSTMPDPTSTRVPLPAAHAGTICPHCGRHMLRCGLCHHWLGTPNPSASTAAAKELSGGAGGKLDDIMAKLITFCKSCGHGFHADHARTWFAKYEQCPVVGCECVCGIR